MTYIETIKRGDREYYYITKNLRVGINKWKKIRVYIKDKKPTKSEIKKYAEQIEKQIEQEGLKKSEYSYLGEEDAETLQDIKKGYKEWLKKTPESLKNKLYDDFVIRFTYHSNAIEGNRLTLRDTYLIIKEKQIPSGAPPKDYNEAINGREVFEFVKKYKGKLSVEFIEKINEILTKNTGVIYPGRVRFFPVRIEGADHNPPHPEEVRSLLKKMIQFYYKNKRKIHPFIMACLVHAQFVEIHPFEDGNGRTGRTLMNWILMQAGYPKMFVPVKSRQKYYEAIDLHNQQNIKGYCEKMFEVVIEQFKL